MTGLDPITVLLPVFGRPALLGEALASVYQQSDPHWRLLIADDGSDAVTADLLSQQLRDPRVSLVRRPQNLGLFANLNQALCEIRTEWHLLLCSDDRLEADAIATLRSCLAAHPDCDLVLSSYRSIDQNGNLRFDVNGLYYDHFAPVSRVFKPQELLAPLLRFGSINGNITGLLIRNSLFERTGPWRADWSQASDWEWLVRATHMTSVLVQRRPVAQVRVHPQQLSVSNRRLQREGEETLQVLASLLRQPALAALPQRFRWAAHHAQFLLWNALKAAPRVGWLATWRQFGLIHRHVGLPRTALAMLRTVPQRIQIRGTDQPLLPPAP